MIEEFSNIVLTCDLPDHGLAAGDIGTVVLVHDEIPHARSIAS